MRRKPVPSGKWQVRYCYFKIVILYTNVFDHCVVFLFGLEVGQVGVLAFAGCLCILEFQLLSVQVIEVGSLGLIVGRWGALSCFGFTSLRCRSRSCCSSCCGWYQCRCCRCCRCCCCCWWCGCCCCCCCGLDKYARPWYLTSVRVKWTIFNNFLYKMFFYSIFSTLNITAEGYLGHKYPVLPPATLRHGITNNKYIVMNLIVRVVVVTWSI